MLHWFYSRNWVRSATDRHRCNEIIEVLSIRISAAHCERERLSKVPWSASAAGNIGMMESLSLRPEFSTRPSRTSSCEFLLHRGDADRCVAKPYHYRRYIPKIEKVLRHGKRETAYWADFSCSRGMSAGVGS
jgi:hypothetical protein